MTEDTVREIFEQYPDAGALTLNGFNYGSSGHETADYSIDVLERFTRRAATAQMLPKVIANPQLIDHVENPHYINLYEGFRSINADGETNATIDRQNNKINLMPPAVDKIFYNHYVLKSKEEFVKKFSRGDAFFVQGMRDMIWQSQSNRASRSIGGCSMWYCGMSYGAIDQATAAMLESLSLRGLVRSAQAGQFTFWQMRLPVDELPALLTRKNSALDDIKNLCKAMIPQLMDFYCTANRWDKHTLLERALNLINVANDRAPDK